MILENLNLTELSILFVILLLAISALSFRWFFNQVRDVCKRVSGYIILGQLVFILFSWGVFLTIFVYYLFKGGQVEVLNIFLTVIVGFLGTIIGVFFSEKAFEKIVKDLEERYKDQRAKRFRVYKGIAERLEELK
tara:strand:+ start:320 stop:724 length:405 start_codon:yes stop_codon:yes gene_type:complete